MTDQIEMLMVLQDLDQMIKSAAGGTAADYEKKLGFGIDGLEHLQATREGVAKKIDPDILHHYNKLANRYDQPIVPLKDHVCLGCFIRQPTGTASVESHILTCESCKRILYELKI